MSHIPTFVNTTVSNPKISRGRPRRRIGIVIALRPPKRKLRGGALTELTYRIGPRRKQNIHTEKDTFKESGIAQKTMEFILGN